MSSVYDRVRQVDIQFDRLALARTAVPLNGVETPPLAPPTSSLDDTDVDPTVDQFDHLPTRQQPHSNIPQLSDRSNRLLSIIASLSVSSSLPKPAALSHILGVITNPVVQQKCAICQIYCHQDQNGANNRLGDEFDGLSDADWLEHTLEWILLAKTTVAVMWILANTVLNDTVALTDHMYYFDDIIGDHKYLVLYTVQIAPLRLWRFCSTVYTQVKEKLRQGPTIQALSPRNETIAGDLTDRSVLEQPWGWQNLYKLVKSTVQSNINHVQGLALKSVKPLLITRSEIMKRRQVINALRNNNAKALGILLGRGLVNIDEHDFSTQQSFSAAVVRSAREMADEDSHWRDSVAQMVSVMRNVFAHLQQSFTDADTMTLEIDGPIKDDPFGARILPADEQNRLKHICEQSLPQYQAFYAETTRRYGKPSRWIRYWLPALVGIMSSGTILRVLTNRKTDIVTWIQDTGQVSLAFWRNWVIEPTRKVLRTIRHDNASEISIASRRSLEGDMDSLERMVVDFVVDEARRAGTDVNSIDVRDIASKVREGDVTPVLLAYENDLRNPLMGTIRGMLVRSLLIQVQKTKVDVALAISGIDNLLRSQELVFGVVSLTPGLLASFGLLKWVSGTLRDRRGVRSWLRKDELVKELRNIDRTLWRSKPENGILLYKDHGLLLCQVHRLRQIAVATLPGSVAQEFVRELDELVDIRVGVARHLAAVTRLQWSFGRWLQ